ncbi:DUF1656 domain-containing protein [Novosphingobium sp.]|uniref:DUF1656 domain-containing protein n=1 Tax=Novosphingobium sp. TaxID=1874826 RepID=UPI0038BC1E3A
MIADYLIGNILVAAAPVDGCIALAVAFVVHRVLAAFRFYRWVWHPVLFDTALFVVIWALLVLTLPSLFPGLIP